MKKIVTVLLIMCLALMMCSCGKEPEEPKEPDFMENYWGDSQKKSPGKREMITPMPLMTSSSTRVP